MIRCLSELTGYDINAIDGKVGSCVDFLFDDQSWTVRHLVVDTGGWIPGRKVIVPPSSINRVNWKDGELDLEFNKKKLEESPSLSKDAPVSRQYEEKYYNYMGWPPYWGLGFTMRSGFNPRNTDIEREQSKNTIVTTTRSFKEVLGYEISNKEDTFGSVEDVIVSDANWKVTGFVVRLSKWLPSDRVIMPLSDIEEISWLGQSLNSLKTKEQIKALQKYSPHDGVNAVSEVRFYDYTGHPVSEKTV
ncbi:MAG: hypothetical protein KDD25_01240 [Bdellovibrionales bacterium]|nr:hypothetical protein [Bdellovibrionales bacterium]